jgi:excisionase family DNA binding protein
MSIVPFDWHDTFKGVPELMTAKELAEVLRVAIKTIFGWVAQGKVPYVRVNGALRFPKGPIIVWLEAESWLGQ